MTGIDDLLDAFHAAAAVADADAYFGAMAEEFPGWDPGTTEGCEDEDRTAEREDRSTKQSVFLGTDATERWDREAFRAYAASRFERGEGWVYEPVERHVARHGEVAWFDERLRSPRHGEARGSGVVVRTAEGWKLAQYVLSFPIPNALAPELLARIRGG